MYLRLKEERSRLKYKQKFIAEETEVHNVTISNYEKGKIAIPASYLAKLAPLGFDIQYIITGVRSGTAPLSPEERELLELYRNANATLKLAAKTTLASGTKAGHVVTVNGSKNTVSVK